MEFSKWRFEDQDYMGRVDCVLVDETWQDVLVFKNDFEEIYANPSWNFCIVIESIKNSLTKPEIFDISLITMEISPSCLCV